MGMGGAERLTLGLAARMAQRGHAVKVVVLREPRPEQWPTDLDVTHLRMRRSPAGLLGALPLAVRTLRGFRPDVVHSHTFFANGMARLLRPFCPAPVISTIHNVYEGGWRRILAYRLTDPLCRHTVAVSQAAAERYVRLHAVPAPKVSVVTNGIELEEFTPDPERRAWMRSELGLGDEFLWLAAGRISPAKDYPNLLRAFAHVRAVHPATQLAVAGGAADSATGRYAGFAVPHGSLEGVRWLGLRRDLPALLDAADGFVLSSAWEGMPLAVAEAMAMAKPVVATDVGGVRELVGDAGWLVPAREPVALAGAMRIVMESTEAQRLSRGRSARRRVEAGFSMEAKAEEWERLYLQVAKE